MIRQITLLQLKELIKSNRSKKETKFYLLVLKEDEFLCDYYKVSATEVEKERKDSLKANGLKYFLQKKDNYPVYHLVEKVATYLYESFGDDNSKEFMELCNSLYYNHLKDEELHSSLDSMIGLFREQAEVASGVLDREFEQE